jgi:hypothetical protein
MPPEYKISDDKKVTVAKILAMRNHWYQAALTVLSDYSAGLPPDSIRGPLQQLLNRYQTKSMESPGQNPDAYVPAAQYSTYFDEQLPFTLAGEIKNVCPFLPATEIAKINQAMAIAFIRAANADPTSWKTIKSLMHDSQRDDYWLSTLTPVNAEFHVTYHPNHGVKGKRYGQTGLTSMNERIPTAMRTAEEQQRPANCWYSELLRSDRAASRQTELFAAFRSGAFCAYGEPDIAQRRAANLARARGVIEAMVIQKLRQLANPQPFLDGEQILELTVVSIDLLSDTSILGDAAMVFDHHAVLNALDEQNQSFSIMWPTANNQFREKKVQAHVNMLDFNFAVNQAATFVQRVDERTTNARSIARLKALVKMRLVRDDATIEQLTAKRNSYLISLETYQKRLASGQTLSAADQAVQVKCGQAKKETEAELRRLERTRWQIRALWKSIKASAMGEYLTPARLANLAYLLGLMVHFNCKSGKDRTGLMDIESKVLARELFINRGADHFAERLPDRKFTGYEQSRHQQMLWESGSLQILERNTRGQSLKVADMRNYPILQSDRLLAERLGGEAIVVDLRGLADYTVLVDKLLK